MYGIGIKVSTWLANERLNAKRARPVVVYRCAVYGIGLKSVYFVCKFNDCPASVACMYEI